MKAYWNTLNEREQGIIIFGLIILFIYIYYLLIYSPLTNKVIQKNEQLIEKAETLQWMNQVRQQSRIKTKKNVSNSQLLTLLATQLKNSTALKFPYQLQQTSSGEVQLAFEEVPFNLLLRWLAQISNEYSIIIKQLEVNRTDTPGMTKLMLIINAV